MKYSYASVNNRIQSVCVSEWIKSGTVLTNTVIQFLFSCVCLCLCVACGLTSRDLWFLPSWVVQGQVQPAVADLQLQSLGLRVQLHREQQPVWVPRPKLKANRETPSGRRCWRKWQEAAAGAHKGAGHQLGLRTREGHIALEDDRPKDTD